MEIKALLFDLDGLLIDSEKIYLKCWIKAAEELNYNLTTDCALQLRSCDSNLARNIVADSLHDSDAYDKIRAKRKELMALYMQSNSLEIKKGVKEFFSAKKIDNYKKYIVTSAIPEDKLLVLEEEGVLKKFDGVITTKQVSKGKPYPDVYLFAACEANVSCEECLAFEDSPNGVISAFNAGCNVVMIPDLSQPDEELLSKCDYVFPILSDSLQCLK